MTCGVCLSEDVEVINIFGEEGKRLEISAIIRQHFWFEPIEDDTVLSRICCPCWEQIANFHIFYTNIKEAHKKLSDRYYANSQYTDGNYPEYYRPENSSYATDQQPECSYGYENSEENGLKDTSKVSKEDDTINKATNEQSYATSDVYDEYYQGNQKDSQESGDPNDEDECLLVKSNYAPSEANEESNSNDIDDSWSSQKAKEGFKKSTKRGESSNESFEDKIVNRDTTSYKRDPRNKGHYNKKDENKIKEEDDLIAKYIKLECEICCQGFPKFFDLSKHYQVTHNISGYARCCDKKLPSRSYALDHINQHINPESYRCKECNKTFASQYAIKNHLAIKHAPETEKIFVCEYCPEKFTNQHFLNQHCTRHISEEEKRVYCIDCRTTFPTALALQMHKNVYHGKLQGHICHVCGKIVRGKAIFAKHVNEHAAELGQETINDPVCPICGKLSASIKTLRHHIRYVHSSHRPHKCTLCGKAFKIRQKLKEHMGSHAVGNPFPCPYCHKRFRSKLHLYSHKYRMHKQEYEEEKQIRFNMMTETFNGMENYENTSMSENDARHYDSSIVLSEDSNSEDDDCYVVA